MTCPDKHGAPCGETSCLRCSPGYDDLRAEVEELRAEVMRLRGELEISHHAASAEARHADELQRECKRLALESVSERCHRTHNQCCDACERLDCCDNTSETATGWRKMKEEVASLRGIKKAAEEMSRDVATCCADEDLAEIRRTVALWVLAGSGQGVKR